MPKDWAALCIGLIVGAYWARVLKLVLKARRRTGRDANFVPPEPLGRALRIVWYPTVVIWIAHPLYSAWQPFGFLYLQPIVRWTSVAIALVAFIATLVCWKKMGKSWRMGIDPNEKTQLVVSGPYAYVRHPIYALSSLMMIASVTAVPTILMIVVGGIHLVFLQWEARREERHLVQIHGPSYANYMTTVWRFIPRPRT
ncbi:MAG TPA: isoprenylcysteine carboxylmethyltransferase family protein [Tepidisphaeraceae bacterium]|jgi:protein-S-isoprenylcysteine O-methyltransferase Ste14|nr:isoprenylcysteine carboxylmethyltransferase family protein [Tepidisphaeraceae bacterium]